MKKENLNNSIKVLTIIKTVNMPKEKVININISKEVYKIINIKLNEVMNYYCKIVLKHTIIIIKFLKILIVYLVEKYYYNMSEVYFILKASKDVDVFNFFITIKNIREKLGLDEVDVPPYIRLIYYYLWLLPLYVYLGPLTWFLLRVVTDKQNWIYHVLDKVIMLPLPLLN